MQLEMIGPEKSLYWFVRFLPVFVAALATSLVATWLCKKVALKLNIVDTPDHLVKTHKKPVAYLGGVGILIGFMTGILLTIAFAKQFQLSFTVIKMLLAIIAGASIACIVGLIDDLVDLKPIQKIAGQVVAGLMLLSVGILPSIDGITGAFGFNLPDLPARIIECIIVIFFVLGATNSLNLLDGLDGLCAGVTAIITVAFLLLAIHLTTWGFSEAGDPVKIIICLALVGGVAGFLPFNKHPAKIFMGDAGSMLLGFVIAALMMLFAEKIPRWWFASIIVFGLPILDTAVALIRRLLNHRPLFVSDRGHIYDQMIDRGIPLSKTVAICYLLAAGYALIGLTMSQFGTKYAVVVYALVFIISALVVWKKGFLKMRGLRGAVQKKNNNNQETD